MHRFTRLPFNRLPFLGLLLLLACPSSATPPARFQPLPAAPPPVFVPAAGARPATGTALTSILQIPDAAAALAQRDAAIAANSSAIAANAAAAAAKQAGLSSLAPGAGLTPAKADGVADDGPALQAQIARARTGGGLPNLLFPGVYRLTAPLIVGAAPAGSIAPAGQPFNPGVQQGWILRGQAGPSIQSVLPGVFGAGVGGGTSLLMGTAGQASVLQTGNGGAFDSQISDIALDGGPDSNATANGLWNGGYTYWSGISARHLRTEGVDTAIRTQGSPLANGAQGKDGEYFNVSDSRLNARHTLYWNDSDFGQALPETWSGVVSQITQAGGTCFIFGKQGSSVGNNFSDTGQAISMTDAMPRAAASPTNVFLELYAAEHLNWFGGRIEQVGTVVKWHGGSPLLSGLINWNGVRFDGMNGFKPLLSGGAAGEQFKFIFTGCSFTSYAFTALTLTFASDSNSQAVFTDCDFYGWSDYSALASNPHVTLIRCRAAVGNGVVAGQSSAISTLIHN